MKLAGPDFPIRNVIAIDIARIRAPSYTLFPDRTEQEHMRRTFETYGVQPAGG